MAERHLFKVHASVLVTEGKQFWLVEEAKPHMRGKWNLPGGHVDHGEALTAAAERELREETGLDLRVSGVIGVYSSPQAVRFVFRAEAGGRVAQAGDEILGVGLFSAKEIGEMAESELVSPVMLRRIILDAWEGKNYPVDLVQFIPYSTLEPEPGAG